MFPLNAEVVESTGQCQRFDIFLVAGSQADTFHEIKDIFIRTVLSPFFNDILYGSFTNTLHGTQAETDVLVLVHTELQDRFVYIRSKNLNAHCLTFVHEFCDIHNVRQTSAQDGSHILGRIVCFQKSRLIGYP